MIDPEDPQGRPDESSDPYLVDARGTSGESLTARGVYTSPDGAMYHAGKLEIVVLDEHDTKIHIIEAVLITPVALRRFNEFMKTLENTVLLEASIEPLH